jgi:hypothetical protein
MQEFVEANIAVQWSKAVWSPYFHDLNLLDYGIWCILHGKVTTTAHPNLESLKRTTQQEWEWGRLNEVILQLTRCTLLLCLVKISVSSFTN